MSAQDPVRHMVGKHRQTNEPSLGLEQTFPCILAHDLLEPSHIESLSINQAGEGPFLSSTQGLTGHQAQG